MEIIFSTAAARKRAGPVDRKRPATQRFGATLALALMVLIGCAEPDTPAPKDAVLIRADQQTVTQAQFERAFSAARIAYSDEPSVSPRVLREARLRLLHQMVEEEIVARRAEELGIAISDADLDAAVAAIKKDYPEDEFEQMLLESAIPYSLWKDRLRVRLLMQKVVDHDLLQSLEITADEIEDYYRRNADAFPVDETAPTAPDLKRRIVERLRREKVEAAWSEWIDNLKSRYGVTINWVLWEKSQPPVPADGAAPKETEP